MKKNSVSLGLQSLRDESGQSLIFVAVFMGLLALGFMAFALDAGNLFRYKRMAQSAANAAALAAAEATATGGNPQADANAMATLNGFSTSLATNPAVVTLTTPQSGNFTGSYIQATVTMPVSTTILRAFLSRMKTVTVSATAIAGGGISSKAAVCDNGDFSLSGGSTIITANGGTNGGIFDSSSSATISVTGGSTLDAQALLGASTGWLSNIQNDLTLTGSHINIPADDIVQGVSVGCNLPLPPVPTWSTCLANPGGSWTANPQTFGPSSISGTICYTALTVGGNGMSDILNPGIYVINGGQLHFLSGTSGFGCAYSSCSNLGGNGVFFYLINGASLAIDGGANVNLVSGGANKSSGSAAPSIGPGYDGILVFQNPSDSAAMTFSGGANVYMNGGIIAPDAPLNISGGSSASLIEGAINVNGLNVSGGTTVKTVTDTNASTISVFNPFPSLVQ
jgi:hypothetical protein